MNPGQDEREFMRHVRVIKRLKEELFCPEEELLELYNKELANIRENARVQEFVPLLTARRVREIFRLNGGRCR
ncbi:MAG: DUF3562 domain-containing protein [Nitrospirota bacterium]